MARLYAVLTEGARILRGTDLQMNGAYHGNSIYLAREPSTTWAYAKACASASETSFFRARAELRNASVILGCKHASNDRNARRSDIHVIADESRVMFRYIFTF